jgi:hypothetical protein
MLFLIGLAFGWPYCKEHTISDPVAFLQQTAAWRNGLDLDRPQAISLSKVKFLYCAELLQSRKKTSFSQWKTLIHTQGFNILFYFIVYLFEVTKLL